jgi:signal transduction protein with GAF and PtsI domain
MPDASMIVFHSAGMQLLKGDGDLKGALGPIIQLAAESAHSRSSSFYLLDHSQQVLKPLVTCGLPESYVRHCGFVAVGDQCCGRAVQLQKPFVVSNMLTDPAFSSARRAAVDSPIKAAFSVPVIQNGICIGSLACHYSEQHLATNEDIDRNRIWATMLAHILSVYTGTYQPDDTKGLDGRIPA